jgi:phosphatidylinositol-3-phosphatase
MHDGTIQQGDRWLQTNLMPYVTWAQNNNSLLIVQFDEDDGTSGNHIVTIFVGPTVRPGKYSERINHYNVLRTIEDMYGLPDLGRTATATSITDVWK